MSTGARPRRQRAPLISARVVVAWPGALRVVGVRPPPRSGVRVFRRSAWVPDGSRKTRRSEEAVTVTVPEENRPKTSTTDEVIESPADTGKEEQQPGASGRSMREAIEEAGITPDDFEK
ncbi:MULTISPECIES: hypothetical protein [Streptomyces]|uniref:hypothetical protein n=1 Tax=Streptomyces TaxID=1883 RepID=UPI0016738C91|nr:MULTISPECIES: hypothetical protein [Streptomyces]MBK3525138.1 hypothetical protein [Streptomyces sp. MBT70]GGR82662.1 hypothetical protein GCM10010236_41670 [Streptomyces eurythermus]